MLKTILQEECMKRLLAYLLFLLFPLTFSAYAADKYILDPTHSYVMWHINHLGFSTQTGKWMVDGTLLLDEKTPTKSKVDVTIQMANIVTGVPKLDEHLSGGDFFDVKKYPTATFVSDKVTVTGKDKALVHGMLTIRGVSKPVILKVTLDKLGVNPIDNKMSAGFAATTEIKRSDFGMTSLLPWLGDDVKIDIGVEAQKAS